MVSGHRELSSSSDQFTRSEERKNLKMKKSILILTSMFILLSSTNRSVSQGREIESEYRNMELPSLEGDPKKPLIVFVTGDEEYRSEEGMPQIAKILNQHHGFDLGLD